MCTVNIHMQPTNVASNVTAAMTRDTLDRRPTGDADCRRGEAVADGVTAKTGIGAVVIGPESVRIVNRE